MRQGELRNRNYWRSLAMKIELETISPDGIYIWIRTPVYVSTWDEALAFIKLFDSISIHPEKVKIIRKEYIENAE